MRVSPSCFCSSRLDRNWLVDWRNLDKLKARASHLDTTIKVLWGGVVRLVSFTRENLGIAPNMDFVEKTFCELLPN